MESAVTTNEFFDSQCIIDFTHTLRRIVGLYLRAMIPREYLLA